jgi:NitT/TauT family transport system substrate-binding protein
MEETRGVIVRQGRRKLLKGVAGLGLSVAGGSLLAGCANQVAPFFASRTGDQLETTRLRIARSPSLCVAPQFLAEPLLRAEGFTDLEYVTLDPTRTTAGQMGEGELDLTSLFSAPLIMRIDAGDPIVFLTGLHVGCFELFGTDAVRSVRDLKGKTVGILGPGGVQHVFLASMAAYVGLDPRVDIDFLSLPAPESMQRLEEGSIDAFLGFPPEPQMLRAKQIGHVVVNSSVDRPWSQYFCCMLAANKEFVQQHPVATKRAMRAILKATDMCAAEPERAAQLLVDNGFASRLDYARQTLHEIPYDKWRDYDPEDAVRFYSLRLQEVGMIKSSPATIIQKGTNWRFLNELKQELKV